VLMCKEKHIYTHYIARFLLVSRKGENNFG
jgi:hypothetical protein